MQYNQPTGNKIIPVCSFCRKWLKKKAMYCDSCSTKGQRKEEIMKQLEIEKENAGKGYNIPNQLFGFPREILLKEYNIKL